MRRLLLWLVILIVVAGGLLYLYPEPIVEMTIERGGTSLADAKVDVESLDISWGGESSGATMQKFTIANPAGFSDSLALSFDSVAVDVDPGRTSFETVAIRELRVERPVIVYELGLGSNNIDKIKKNVEINSGGAGGDSEGGFAPRYIIDHLVVSEGELRVQAGKGKLASVKLPAIDLSGIGADSNGVSAGELGRIVMTQLNTNVSAAAATGIITDALKGGVGAVGGTGDKIGDTIKGIFD